MIELVRCGKYDSAYVDMRNRHYIPNKDCIGLQLHYLVMLDGEQVGIISASSPTYSVKARDDFFGLDRDPGKRGKQLKHIANNSVFRLEKNLPNLGTMVLAKFRSVAAWHWKEFNGIQLVGWETFVEPSEQAGRHGALYRADNWVERGLTKGTSKLQKGAKAVGKSVVEHGKTTQKLIYCRWGVDEARSSRRRKRYFSKLPEVSWVEQPGLF